MKKFSVLTVVGLFLLSITLSAAGFAGGKETKSASKDAKAACCTMDKSTASKDAKECTDKDAAKCDMSKSKDCCKDGKGAKGSKTSNKSKKSATTTTSTDGTK